MNLKWPDDFIDKLIVGDSLNVMKGIPDNSIQCCVTSPPYWGLRDYGLEPSIWDAESERNHQWGDNICEKKRGAKHGKNAQAGNTLSGISGTENHQGQFCERCGAWRGSLGLEPTPELYVLHTTEIFHEVYRVLKKDGTLWLNLGDSYWGGKGKSSQAWSTTHQDRNTIQGPQHQITGMGETRPSDGNHPIYKPKDLCMIPARVAIALQKDGWYVRSDIIWHKPNPMPESVKDRPTKSHEYIFLMTKSARYYYDADAIREPHKESSIKRDNAGYRAAFKGRHTMPSEKRPHSTDHNGFNHPGGRNKRTVWTVPTKPYRGAHFATFPPKLITPCILAGSKEGDIILDPFGGSGTVGMQSRKLGRKFIHIDLGYHDLAEERLRQEELLNGECRKEHNDKYRVIGE